MTRALVVGCLVAVPALTAAASTSVGAVAPVGGGRQQVSLRLPATAPARRVNAQWNAIAVRTIVSENLTPISVAPLYLSFSSIAMYDAVVAIRGGFEPYALRSRPAGARHASAEAAAVTAAYTVLKTYFPTSTANLDTNYAASLAQVPSGAARDRGVSVGQAAAQAIIDLRVDDGRDASVTLDTVPAPGVWRPTPPALAPMLVPWLGFVRPLVLRSPTQIALPGPPDLTSDTYTRDFREVKRMGAADSTVRTPAQTETALFWNDSSVAQYQAAMRGIAATRNLALVRGARMFAMVNTGTADSMISCWRTKYDQAFWRPITGIQLAGSDGNQDTRRDASWTPLVTTPPYPEYTSGHACMTGSVARGLSQLFGARHLDLDVSSTVTGTTRHFVKASDLNRQTMNARIWLGLHFRTAMEDGNQLGQRAAAYVARHEFQNTSG